MKIVIEGCDGVGKTSIAKILAEKYGCDIVHMTSQDPGDYEFYKQSLRKENVIYDRNVLGEMVYPHVFNRQKKLAGVELREILHHFKKDVYFFVLTADPETIRLRLSRRGNEASEILESIDYINAKFKTLVYEYKLSEIDTTQMKIEDVANKIIEIIESKENK